MVSYGHILSLIPGSNGGSAEITANSDRRPPLSRICTSSSPWIAVATKGCCIVWPEFGAFQLLWFWIIIFFYWNWDNLKEDVIILVLFCGNGLVRLQRSRLVSSECPYPPLWGSSENGKDFRAQHSTSPSVFPIVKLKISVLQSSYPNYSPHLVFWKCDDVEWCWPNVSAIDKLVTLQQLLWGFQSTLHCICICDALAVSNNSI